MKAPGTIKKRKRKARKDSVEPEPDAWDRFEKAIHKIVPPKKAKVKDEKPAK